MFDMAVEQFEQALERSMVVDRPEKEILYNLGMAADRLGDLAKAEDAFKRIYNVDINFRDVKDKIEAIYKKRQASEAKEQTEAS